MPIDLLLNGRFLIPEIEEMPFGAEECPVCDLLFTDMTERDVFENHVARCTEQKAADERQMVAMGYKKTSRGWIMP